MAAAHLHRLHALHGDPLLHLAGALHLFGVGNVHRVLLLNLLGVGDLHRVGRNLLLGVGHHHRVGGGLLFLHGRHHRVGLLDLLGVGDLDGVGGGLLLLHGRHHRVGLLDLLGVGHHHRVGGGLLFLLGHHHRVGGGLLFLHGRHHRVGLLDLLGVRDLDGVFSRLGLRDVLVDRVVHGLGPSLRNLHGDRAGLLLGPRDALVDRVGPLAGLGRVLGAGDRLHLGHVLLLVHRLGAARGTGITTTTTAADGAITATLAAATAGAAVLRPRAGAQGDDGDGRQEAGKNFANHEHLQRENRVNERFEQVVFTRARSVGRSKRPLLLKRPNHSAA